MRAQILEQRAAGQRRRLGAAIGRLPTIGQRAEQRRGGIGGQGGIGARGGHDIGPSMTSNERQSRDENGDRRVRGETGEPIRMTGYRIRQIFIGTLCSFDRLVRIPNALNGWSVQRQDCESDPVLVHSFEPLVPDIQNLPRKILPFGRSAYECTRILQRFW